MPRSAYCLILALVLLAPALMTAQPARLIRDTGSGRPFNIYLPAGYDSSDERFPVMYFFRGDEDEWLNRSEDASRRGDIRTVIDSLVRNGSIGKAIYVFPYTPLPTAFPEDGFVPGTMMPYVDSVYRTLPTRSARAIDGFSWGGLFSMTFIIRYPHLIASAGAYDPSVFALPYAEFESRRDDDRHMRWMRMLHVYVTSAILGGNNNAGTSQLLDSLAQYGVTNLAPTLVLDPAAQHNWYFADLHASRNIPRHWHVIGHPGQNTVVSITGPVEGGQVSGSVPVGWSAASADTTLQVFVQISRDLGQTWRELSAGADANGTVSWNTLDDPDGSFYTVRVIAAGDTSFGEESVVRVRVNNPGNAPPEAYFSDLSANSTLSGTATIRWIGEDAEQDPSTASVQISPDGGITWLGIPGSFSLNDSVLWDTRQYPNGVAYLLRLLATDGADSAVVLSPMFGVSNVRQQLSGTLIERSTMRGDADISVHVVDQTSVAGQRYRVTFSRIPGDPYHQASGPLSYEVRNLTADIALLAAVPVRSDVEEGPVFDGLRLSIRDAGAIDFNADGSGWMAGTSNLSAKLIVPSIVLPPDTFQGRPFPADYILRVSDDVVDTTISRFGTVPTPVRWKIMNRFTNRAVLQEYLDVDMTGTLTHGDEVYFWEVLYRSDGQEGAGPDTVLTWQAVFSSPPTLFPPAAGDSLLWAVRSPLHSGDSFEFDAVLTDVAKGESVPASAVLHEAYPNPFNPSTTISFSMPATAIVAVDIYNMLGQRVEEFVPRPYSHGDHRILWNAAGLPTGIYVVRVTISDAQGRSATHHLYNKLVLLK